MRLLALLLIALLSGCASAVYTPSGLCVDGDSVILSVMENPSGLDKALLMVNFSALEKKTFTPQQVAKFLDVVETKVNQGISYLDLADHLINEFDNYRRYVGVSIILLGDQISDIGLTGGQSIIYDCDAQLILTHIDNQRRLVALYGR